MCEKCLTKKGQNRPASDAQSVNILFSSPPHLIRVVSVVIRGYRCSCMPARIYLDWPSSSYRSGVIMCTILYLPERELTYSALLCVVLISTVQDQRYQKLNKHVLVLRMKEAASAPNICA